VFANLAMSADGKIATTDGAPGRFTSQADRAHMDLLRADADAVLIGAHTLRVANPDLTIKDAAAIAARRDLGHDRQPQAIVVSGSGVVPQAARIFAPAKASSLASAPRPLVITSAAACAQARAQLREVADVEVLPGPPFGGAALLALLGQRHIRRLLVEGGGETLWPLVKDGVLDALHVTLAPCLLGGAQAPTLLGGPGLALGARIPLALAAVQQVGQELFVTYRVVRPPAQAL
jgi:riboflavin-specific deaminase-like protein